MLAAPTTSARFGRLALSLLLVAGITSGGPARRLLGPTDDGASEQAPTAMFEDRAGPLTLAPARSVPVAAPAALAHQGRLRAREVFAFAPWWSLDHALVMGRGMTTLAYFGIDIAGDGSLIRGGNGWTGFESQALVDLISRAHKAGTRVVLTAKSFDADVLRALVADSRAPERLARELSWTIRSKKLDGVNFDFEFFGDTYRARFTRFLGDVVSRLRAIDKRWQITLDTYATSAQVDDGFFDISGIARAVDALFVMGYDMYHSGAASPNAPLPQYERSIDAYRRLAPADKIIYGTPFYGYDWPTRDNRPHSPAVGSPTPITYSEIAAAGHPRYWDASASVPWTAYKVGNQWHEIYYDDASSLALKAKLADRYKLRGVGAWALRMDANDGTLLGALTGGVSAIVLGPSGPAIAPASSSPTTRPRPSSTPAKPKPTRSPSPSPSPSPSQSPISIPLPIG